MNNIPGIAPEVKAIIEKEREATRAEKEKEKEEDEKLNQMVNALYKPDYKMYIFKGDEMYNEEFLAALDNSPTYSRTAQELERMVAIFGGEAYAKPVEADKETSGDNNGNPIEEPEIEAEEDNDDDSLGQTVFDNSLNRTDETVN